MRPGVDAKKIRGVIPALFTCFDEKGRYDGERTRKVVRFLLSQGVHGLYIAGSTGEGLLMSPEERMRLAEDVLEEVAGKIPVIVHVGAIGSRLSADLARHAERAGADAVSSVPPFYFRFGIKDIVRYYEEVTGACGLPMFLYNVSLAGQIDFSLVEALARIPGVAGMKFTSPAHHEIMRLKQLLGEGFMLYSGADEMAMSGLAYGADGIIGTFYNLIPDLFLKLYEAYLREDYAAMRRFQGYANQVIYKVLEYDVIGLTKQMMSWVGVDAGYARSPLPVYSALELEAIQRALREMDLPEGECRLFDAIGKGAARALQSV